MEAGPKPPLPWEHKTAIGALTLVAMQAIHETFATVTGSRALGRANLDLLSPVLLAAAGAAAFGIWDRSRRGRRLALGIGTGTGLLLLGAYWNVLRPDTELQNLIRTTEGEYEIHWPTLTPFGRFWVIARCVLLLSVPAMLLLGELRKKLRAG